VNLNWCWKNNYLALWQIHIPNTFVSVKTNPNATDSSNCLLNLMIEAEEMESSGAVEVTKEVSRGFEIAGQKEGYCFRTFSHVFSFWRRVFFGCIFFLI
jgi:hypothetical protein